ncbi:MAG TPA: chromate efflux transporter [Acidimicrobiales bacterium]
MSHATGASAPIEPVPLRVIAHEWGRIGLLGFGGPPAHIALLRHLTVDQRQWMNARDFEHAVAAANLLPGPASTQLMIYGAWRLRGVRGALVGGIAFIAPGLVLIMGLSVLFFAGHPSQWLRGAALGADAVVPAIALRTAGQLATPSWNSTSGRARRLRWVVYVAVGIVSTLVAPALVVVALVGCGVAEILARHQGHHVAVTGLATLHGVVLGGVGALAWVALKVGALSYGGGFVIIPLMQHDVVNTYHWMTGAQFLNAVALGQVTPGPVVLTVAAVGYAAHGLPGAALATVIAFAPSFLFVTLGARHFDRLRANDSVVSFLAGASPSVIGAIGASAVALAILIAQLWQGAILLVALIWLLGFQRSATMMLLMAAVLGALLSGVVPL